MNFQNSQEESLEIELPDFITNLKKRQSDEKIQDSAFDKAFFGKYRNQTSQNSSQDIYSVIHSENTANKQNNQSISCEKYQDCDSIRDYDRQRRIDKEDSLQRQSAQVKEKKTEKGKIYAKKYRQKKSKLYKEIMEENRFLKKKIDDLSFRLNETELQLNRLKNSPNSKNISNYKNLKENCTKKILEMFEKKQKISPQQLTELDKQISEVRGFSKDKIKLLNYHMSEILDNFIDNSIFYLTDCHVQNRGPWTQDVSKLRKIDQQMISVFDLQGQHFEETRMKLKKIIPHHLLKQMIKFHDLWKNLYQAYLKAFDQSLLIEIIHKGCRKTSFAPYMKQGIQVRMYLFFQKIKYRKDFRELKQRWYQDTQHRVPADLLPMKIQNISLNSKQEQHQKQNEINTKKKLKTMIQFQKTSTTPNQQTSLQHVFDKFPYDK